MQRMYLALVVFVLLSGQVLDAHAVEIKAKGSWQLGFDYIDGGNFMGKNRAGKNMVGQQWAPMHQQRDNFEAVQRLFLQMQVVASEALSGTVFFEVGEQRWGMAAQGGALGTDGTMVKVKHAYMDWLVPKTKLKLRMGLQGIRLPGFALESPVFDDDVAGIVASYTFNEHVGLTALWMRPYNDVFTGTPTNYMDNMDLFGLILPVKMPGVSVTPWVVGGAMGPNVMPFSASAANRAITWPQGNPSSGQALSGLTVRDGLFPAAFSTGRPISRISPSNYADLFWGGISFDVTAADPWRFAADFIYGQVQHDQQYLKRQGWFGMFLTEYKASLGTPGIYGWYFSGDDANPHNGSERLPYISTASNLGNALSSFGYRGNAIMTGGKGVLGANPNGTWGVGARVKNLTFMEKLSHTLRVNVFGGTNDPAMAEYITGRRASDDAGRSVYRNTTDFNSFGTYLTRNDMGIEVNIDSTYKIYDNLRAILELGYIHLWLDEGTWGKTSVSGPTNLNYKDAWKASLIFIYDF